MLEQLLRVPETRKAWLGGIVAALGSTVAAYGPESEVGKLASIIGAFIAALIGVYQVVNKKETA